jgi:hypothetical protein
MLRPRQAQPKAGEREENGPGVGLGLHAFHEEIDDAVLMGSAPTTVVARAKLVVLLTEGKAKAASV